MRLPFGQGPDAWLAELAELPLVHQPGERVTYGHSIDVVGVIASRIEGKPFHQVLDERILQPLGMIDTGFLVTLEGRRRAATMYRLDENDQLRHDVMGQPHITPPAFCNAGGGLWSTADDYLRFVEMLLRRRDGRRRAGAVTGIGTADAYRSAHRRAASGTTFSARRSGSGVGSGSTCRWSPIRRSRPRCSGRVVLGTFSWPGAYGTWWQADPAADLILLYLIQNMPALTADAAAAVAGNTSRAKLQAVQPKFVHRTYRALGL